MLREEFILEPNGWVPNNPARGVVVYRSVETGECAEVADKFEARFAANGWPPCWRDTIYEYHHFHSTAHEALGVAAGIATLMLGGPHGRKIALGAGDALILPVGTGHCRIAGSDDFLVVGSYPAGQDWDICREAISAETLARIRSLPTPDRDPVTGSDIW